MKTTKAKCPSPYILLECLILTSLISDDLKLAHVSQVLSARQPLVFNPCLLYTPIYTRTPFSLRTENDSLSQYRPPRKVFERIIYNQERIYILFPPQGCVDPQLYC